MSHSPGPWVAIDTDGEHHAIVAPDADQDHFTVICIGPDDATENANARLIAAAPDLLAALETMLGEHELLTSLRRASGLPPALTNMTIDAAHAAIAKAKGE